MKKILFLMAMLLTVSAGQAKTRTAVFTTKPQMHCRKCENRMTYMVNLLKGVKKVEANSLEQTIQITFNDKVVNEETLLKAFKLWGYEARQLKEGETVTEQEAHECKEEKKGE